MKRSLRAAAGAAVALALMAGVATVRAAAKAPSISVYPSSQTVTATGALPAGRSAAVLDTAIGGLDAAQIVVRDASSVAASIDVSGLGGLDATLAVAHYVSFGTRLVPDALLPWDGSERATEQVNQPLYLLVNVPYGTTPGTYTGTVTVTANGAPTSIPLTVHVFAVTLPKPNAASGNLLTSFHLSAETYINAVGKLARYKASTQFQGAQAPLYSFLASWRISPASWGYGEPKSAGGYTRSPKWWLSPADNAPLAIGSPPGFSALRIPISNNRTSPRNYIAGLDPSHPETWCDYLGTVHAFWEQHGWLDGTVQYLYGQDEPGLAGQQLVERQARVLHRCFPGGKVLMTGNPSPTGANSFLWTDPDGGTVDIWTVLANRYYGKYTVPKDTKAGIDRSRESLAAIDRVRKLGKSIWTYNYAGTQTPGYLASEPLSDARMLELWAALEGIQGVLYGEGTTNYKADPLRSVANDGAYVLLYPGADGPVPSARLLQIRSGIEDWAVFDVVRRRLGAAAVRKILGDAGLFSADARGVKLACTVGCQLKSDQPNSWPLWSHDATTPARIEAARLAALRLASS